MRINVEYPRFSYEKRARVLVHIQSEQKYLKRMMFLSCKKIYLTTIAFSWVFIVLGAGKDSDPILHREKRCKYTLIYNTMNGNGIIFKYVSTLNKSFCSLVFSIFNIVRFKNNECFGVSLFRYKPTKIYYYECKLGLIGNPLTVHCFRFIVVLN